MKSSNLMHVLQAREDHVRSIDQLQVRYKCTVLAAKMNIPGPEKQHLLYQKALHVCEVEIHKILKRNGCLTLYQEMRSTAMGDTFYLVVDVKPGDLKKWMIEIEDHHLLGRLFDIDVYDSKGISLSRDSFGHRQRKCLLCEDNAHACARSRKHELNELIDHIQRMISTYLGGEMLCQEPMNKCV